MPILGQNHWENLLQRFLREVSVKHLSGEIYAEVKVSVGFMETFFWEITLRNGGFAGKIWENHLYLEMQTHAKWGRCRILAEQSTYIQQQLYVSHDLGRNCSECGEFRCMILARGDCLRCWEIFCGEPH